MSEIIRTFESTEDYLNYINKQKIDDVYKEAVDEALDKETLEDLLNEAFRNLADAEAEVSILEDLFIGGKVDKNEVTQAKRRHTKAKNRLEELYKLKEG